jgi:rod shape-determining protein MreC
VDVDDLLVTSGKGKWFPKGLPVARVTSVVKRELGRDQEVTAAPTVNFSHLDAVLILVSPPSEELFDTTSSGLSSAKNSPSRGKP